MFRTGQHIPPAPGGNGQRGARPAAAPAQPFRQPGGDRDRVPAALEGDHVPGRRAVGGQRGVASGEPARVVAPQPQRPRGHQQLLGVQAAGGRPGVLRGEQRAPPAVVHQAPVVRIHQGVPGQLTALVHVGRARHGELHQLGTQRVHPRRRGDAAGERRDLAGERGVAEHGRGERERAGLVVLVRLPPRRGRLRLPHRLDQVAGGPLVADRPGAGQGLPEQVLGAGLGRAAAGQRERPVVPAGDLGRPLPGDLGEHGQPGPDVLLALGVVGGQRGHGGRPVPGEPRRERVELPGRDAEPVRLAADLVQRGQPGPAVERGVLDALGHHRAAGLLEAHGELPGRRCWPGGASPPWPALVTPSREPGRSRRARPARARPRRRGQGAAGRAAGPPPRRPRPPRSRRRCPARARRAPRTPGTPETR